MLEEVGQGQKAASINSLGKGFSVGLDVLSMIGLNDAFLKLTSFLIATCCGSE